MLRPLLMQYVSVHVLSEEAPLAALVLAEHGVFNPEISLEDEESFPDHPGSDYRELCRTAQSHLDRIERHLGLVPLPLKPEDFSPIPEDELRALHDSLRELWTECSKCEEDERRVAEGRKQLELLNRTLDDFANLQVDLGRLRKPSALLDLHVGTVPLANLDRLEEALGLAGYIVSPYRVKEETAHVVVAGPAGQEKEITTVLEAAGCRAMDIPAEFSDFPEKVRKDLEEQAGRLDKESEEIAQRIRDGREKYSPRLREAERTLAIAGSYANLSGALRSRGGLSVVSGWVPKEKVSGLRGALFERLRQRVEVSVRDPRPDELPRVPSAVQHPWFLRPFLTLVRTYGVPRYGEFDPTILFAITYVAMFGMMFGDVGQGAIIALGGLALRKKLQRFTTFAVAIGVSSTAFGFVYGSVFGFEDIVHPVWMSPLSDPMLMLTLALYWGIGFILLAISLTVRNRLAEGRYKEALLDGRGLVGMVFYLGLLFAAYRLTAGAGFGLLEKAAVFLPLAVIMGYQWHENRVPLSEKFLVVAIEGFETVMSYISNTLSFLRVAAFSLNHVALSIAIFTMAKMMATTGHWITIVLGNVFILVMEGGIVAIQVLRLEYYEGFSRFFSGDGREFRPLTLATGSNTRT